MKYNSNEKLKGGLEPPLSFIVSYDKTFNLFDRAHLFKYSITTSPRGESR